MDKFFKKGAPFERGLAAYKSEDYKTAIEAFKPLAENGNVFAQWNLYLSYKKTLQVGKANDWCTKAAKHGYVPAQMELGWLYSTGGLWNHEINQRKAAYWYTQAAEQDDSKAQLNLGDHYKDGKGVLKDLKKARQLTLKQLIKGRGRLKFIWRVCATGGRRSKDVVQAYAWWTIASSQSDDGPFSLGSSTKKRLEDRLQLNPEELDKAKKLTRHLYDKIYGELKP